MGKIIALVNQKGGVGKTTTTLELSTLYARQGKKVLAIDMDGQRTLSKFVKANLKKSTLRDVLLTLQDISEEMNSIDNINEEEFTDSITKDAIQHIEEGFDIIPASNKQDSSEKDFNETTDLLLIADMFDELVDDYDYIFLDCAPARGPLLFMAYIACDYCIVVSDAEISSIDGIKNIIIDLQTLEKNTIKAKAKILGLLLTQNKDYNVHLEQYQRLIEFTKYGAVPFDTTIYEGVIVKEAHNKYMSISAYVDAGNRAIKQKAKSVLDSYKDLQREIEERIKEMEA